jgi:hypothetical protein
MVTRKRTKAKVQVINEPKPEPKPKPEAQCAEAPNDMVEYSADWLKWCGSHLDDPPPDNRRIGGYGTSPAANSWREYLMWALLKIRNKGGALQPFELNRAQHDLNRRSTRRNIVLKARQLGVTTYVAARLFINSITREGTLGVQVAHDQRSAEKIFRIVHRLLENLPTRLRNGALVTSRANVRQIVFPVLEQIFGAKSGSNKRAAALSFVQTAVSATNAIESKNIVDPPEIPGGLGQSHRRCRGLPECIRVG